MEQLVFSLIIPPEPARTCKLMRMTGSKKYSPVGTKAQLRVGLDFLSEKIEGWPCVCYDAARGSVSIAAGAGAGGAVAQKENSESGDPFSAIRSAKAPFFQILS